MRTTTIRKTALVIALSAVVAFCLCAYAEVPSAATAGGAGPMFFSDGYAGGTYLETQTEQISYARKTEDNHSLGGSFPNYYNTSSQLVNYCANVAGANVIGYYDRYFANLIPDYTPGISRGGSYSYYPMSMQMEKKQAVIDELYTLMGTNTEASGTSYDQYVEGFDDYVTAKGYTATHSSAMSGGNLSVDAVIDSIEAGEPVVLFLSGYNVASLAQQSGTDVYNKQIYGGNHMVVVYGVNTVRYYNSADQLVAVKTLMRIATGFSDAEGYYYIVGNNGSVIHADAVDID